jgi:hypothetical protein
MQVTDGFFTDYHWPLENLRESIDTFNKYLSETHSSYDIFYGNDIYGRGTYGGGQYNTHLAI